MKKKNIGSDFDEFLKEEGILEGVQEVATKKVCDFCRSRKGQIITGTNSLFEFPPDHYYFKPPPLRKK